MRLTSYKQLFAICLFILLVGPSCQRLTKWRLAGTYCRADNQAPPYLQDVRLTETKCIMTMPVVGEVAQDYTVENGIIYVGGSEGQICFTVDGPGIISNHGMLGIEGTYVKTN